jgi:hypothetical protein
MARAERKENGERRMSNRSVDKFLGLNKMAKPTLFVHRYFEFFAATVSDDASKEIPFRMEWLRCSVKAEMNLKARSQRGLSLSSFSLEYSIVNRLLENPEEIIYAETENVTQIR